MPVSVQRLIWDMLELLPDRNLIKYVIRILGGIVIIIMNDDRLHGFGVDREYR
jgi:hypothetical protein